MKFVLSKMNSEWQADQAVQYSLKGDDGVLKLNSLIGQTVKIESNGHTVCLGCGKRSKKSLQQGHCYLCSRSLARCDICIVRPELCHFSKGSCREPEWGQANCFIPHTLYLANSSGLKVGITRAHQRITRWIDQGAVEAIAVINLENRLAIGELEHRFKAHFADRTNWRNMLKGDVPPLDLAAERERALGLLPEINDQALSDAIVKITYPVLEHPKKVTSLNLEKTPRIEGTLLGIKGQYMIFDKGVINIRSFSGYEVELSSGSTAL
jgi:hypothetical protein